LADRDPDDFLDRHADARCRCRRQANKSVVVPRAGFGPIVIGTVLGELGHASVVSYPGQACGLLISRGEHGGVRANQATTS
jgi:hypothetical protein